MSDCSPINPETVDRVVERIIAIAADPLAARAVFAELDLDTATAVRAELEQRAENPNPAPYVMPAELRPTAVQSIARTT